MAVAASMCPYALNVMCGHNGTAEQCQRCGWNPEVSARRKAQYLQEHLKGVTTHEKSSSTHPDDASDD